MQKTSPPTTKELRVFALILATGFLVIGAGIPFLKGKKIEEFHLWPLVLSLVLCILGMLAPKLLIHPRKVWMAIGEILGKINSTILFTIVYFLIFSTIGLLFKIFKRDRLKTEFRKVNSTMIMKNEISTFEDPF